MAPRDTVVGCPQLVSPVAGTLLATALRQIFAKLAAVCQEADGDCHSGNRPQREMQPSIRCRAEGLAEQTAECCRKEPRAGSDEQSTQCADAKIPLILGLEKALKEVVGFAARSA